jgi:hypothetical protein
MSSDPLKIVVVGLDGAAFDLTYPRVKEPSLRDEGFETGEAVIKEKRK